jgi:hypothetical protein
MTTTPILLMALAPIFSSCYSDMLPVDSGSSTIIMSMA